LSITLDLQVITTDQQIPELDQIQQWLDAALLPEHDNIELTIRIVDKIESQTLNHQYRGIDKATNVLSFPFEVPEGITLNLLGDLVICAEIVANEAQQQHKTFTEHWAHMVIHGCLHLLGYDHIDDNDAEEMENLEIDILSKLGFNNPYIQIN